MEAKTMYARVGKATALLLVLAMLLTLMACGNTTSADESQTRAEPDTQAGTGNETDAESETGRLDPHLPDKTFEGQTLSALHWEVEGVGTVWIPWEEFYQADMTGDTMANLIYFRGEAIKEKFKCDFEIEYTFTEDMGAVVERLMSTGSKDYDLCMQRGARIKHLYTGNYFLNYEDIPYINLSAPWWGQNALETLRLGKVHQFATSEMLYLDKGATAGVFYNATVMGNYQSQIGNKYNQVRNNTWTLEQLIDDIETVAQDLDEDGFRNSDEDLVGMVNGDDPVRFLYTGCGGLFMRPDGDGYFEYCFQEPDNLDLMEKIFDEVLYTDAFRNAYVNPTPHQMFEEDMALYTMEVIKSVHHYRSMESDYGILPVPKLDEISPYRCEVSPHHDTWMSVFHTTEDPEFVGAVLEALAWESYYSVSPDFYEVIIEGRGTRDEESREMLGIIFDTRTYDPGLIFDLATMGEDVLRRTATGLTNFSSFYQEHSAQIESELEELNDLIFKNS